MCGGWRKKIFSLGLLCGVHKVILIYLTILYFDEPTFAFIIVRCVSSHYVLISGVNDSRIICQIPKFIFLTA
jgi:hypothetical protein